MNTRPKLDSPELYKPLSDIYLEEVDITTLVRRSRKLLELKFALDEQKKRYVALAHKIPRFNRKIPFKEIIAEESNHIQSVQKVINRKREELRSKSELILEKQEEQKKTFEKNNQCSRTS